MLTLAIATASAMPDIARAQARDSTGVTALRIFLDCPPYICDFDFFRSELASVNWVRDRQLADVQILVTTQQTGSGTLHVGSFLHSASITLIGNYTTSQFHAAKNPNTQGTLITDPPASSSVDDGGSKFDFTDVSFASGSDSRTANLPSDSALPSSGGILPALPENPCASPVFTGSSLIGTT